jgi:hypothetical protein
VSTPVPTNQTASVVNTAIDGVFQVGVTLAETSLKTAVPVLGWPVIGTVVNWVIQLIANQIYQYFALFVTFEIISVQTDLQVNDSQKALAALKAAQNAIPPNPQAIATALLNFQNATKTLTNFTGSANPGQL